jgi:hypothetical protein
MGGGSTYHEVSVRKWFSGAVHGLADAHVVGDPTAQGQDYAIRVDNTGPTAQLTSPVADDVLKDTVAVVGTAQDFPGSGAPAGNLLWYRVEYQAAGSGMWSLITESTTGVENGTLANWNTTTVADGDYTLRLTVRDKAGNQTQDTVAVKVDNTDPKAEITSPEEDDTVSGTINIEGTAQDYQPGTSTPSGNFQWYRVERGAGASPSSWTEITTSTSPVENGTLATWDTTGVADGVYTLRLTVRDQADNEAQDTVTVTVDNP